MRPWILVGAAAVVLLAFLTARILLQRDGAARDADGGATSSSGSNRAQDPASDDPAVRGKAAYFKHCVACHSPDTDEYVAGASLKNYFRNPPTELSDGRLFPRTDAAIRELIEKGTKNMPPLSQGMTPQEIGDILDYLHTL
ncbi:MAG: cytochrome c [Acidobacteria bacterium]|nr:cytochrome c [Acidobacteriota bacterium]